MAQRSVEDEPKSALSQPTRSRACRVNRQRQAEAVIRPLTRDAFVFQREDGRPLSFTTMWKAWRRLLRKADVRLLGVHGARHTTATLLLERGVDAKDRDARSLVGRLHLGRVRPRHGPDEQTGASVMDDLFSTGSAVES